VKAVVPYIRGWKGLFLSFEIKCGEMETVVVELNTDSWHLLLLLHLMSSEWFKKQTNKQKKKTKEQQ